MAIYRSVQMSFWTDGYVVDEYTPEDKYFYLYCLTNPHTNLCGCYEISIKQMADETGYTKETIEKLIKRFSEIHKTIIYSKETRELCIANWYKYNWTSSEKFRKPLLTEIENVKNTDFKRFLGDLFNGKNATLIPYRYGSDTTVTVTVTDTVSDTVSVSEKKKKSEKEKNSQSKVYFPNDEQLNDAFEHFAEMRKKIKSPLTDYAAELAIKKLQKLAADNITGTVDNDIAIQILNQSTMNSWKGLFELKGSNTGSRKQSGAIDWDNV